MFSWPSLHERMCRAWGSNSGPLACQADTFPIELPRPVWGKMWTKMYVISSEISVIRYRDCFSYTVSHKDNRIDAKLGTYKSLHFACSAVYSMTKTLDWFASMRFSVASLRQIASLSTSRMHFISHVVMNQCGSATFNTFIMVGVLFVENPGRNRIYKTLQMFRLQHVVLVQAIISTKMKNKYHGLKAAFLFS